MISGALLGVLEGVGVEESVLSDSVRSDELLGFSDVPESTDSVGLLEGEGLLGVLVESDSLCATESVDSVNELEIPLSPPSSEIEPSEEAGVFSHAHSESITTSDNKIATILFILKPHKA